MKITKIHNKAIIPQYQTEGSAGFDLHAVGSYIIAPGEVKLIKTGLAIELPKGFEMQIRPRSGLALKHGITVLNSPATIDSDYRGEVGVILINNGLSSFIISEGDRIAQGVISRYITATFEEVEVLSETERGERGFGSTGSSYTQEVAKRAIERKEGDTTENIINK